MTNKTKWIQKIFFGPPGCGKSYRVRKEATDILGIEDPKESGYVINTTFHPEYGYGDFVAKLLPQTKEKGQIEYRIHAGPLIKALAHAIVNKNENVLLVIDEINRGNCAQIFGDIFQLLDRGDDGLSEYDVHMSDMIADALRKELDKKDPEEFFPKRKLRLPPNLSIIGTMNTSDESVYYMDTAFKRRWDFEHMPWDGAVNSPELTAQKNARIKNAKHTWHEFLTELNDFIAIEFKGRSIDDKQVGIWFLKASNMRTEWAKSNEVVAVQAKWPDKTEKLRNILGVLWGEPMQKEWVKHFPAATEYPVEKIIESNRSKKQGFLDCISVKKSLEGDYEIVGLTDEDFGDNPKYLADHLLKRIGSQNLEVIFKDAPVLVGANVPEIELDAIQNKLMFFLWDNVFSRDRTPLFDLLKKGNSKATKPHTFGEFSVQAKEFIDGVMAHSAGIPDSK